MLFPNAVYIGINLRKPSEVLCIKGGKQHLEQSEVTDWHCVCEFSKTQNSACKVNRKTQARSKNL